MAFPFLFRTGPRRIRTDPTAEYSSDFVMPFPKDARFPFVNFFDDTTHISPNETKNATNATESLHSVNRQLGRNAWAKAKVLVSDIKVNRDKLIPIPSRQNKLPIPQRAFRLTFCILQVASDKDKLINIPKVCRTCIDCEPLSRIHIPHQVIDQLRIFQQLQFIRIFNVVDQRIRILNE